MPPSVLTLPQQENHFAHLWFIGKSLSEGAGPKSYSLLISWLIPYFKSLLWKHRESRTVKRQGQYSRFPLACSIDAGCLGDWVVRKRKTAGIRRCLQGPLVWRQESTKCISESLGKVDSPALPSPGAVRGVGGRTGLITPLQVDKVQTPRRISCMWPAPSAANNLLSNLHLRAPARPTSSTRSHLPGSSQGGLVALSLNVTS